MVIKTKEKKSFFFLLLTAKKGRLKKILKEGELISSK